MATALVALTLTAATFLPADLPHLVTALEVRDVDSLMSRMDFTEFPPPARHLASPQRAGAGVEKWRGLVEKYFDAGDVDRALCLMGYESGGVPDAKNPTSSARGLMQVMASIWAPAFDLEYDDLYDPEINIRVSAEIKNRQGWMAWAPYVRGECR